MATCLNVTVRQACDPFVLNNESLTLLVSRGEETKLLKSSSNPLSRYSIQHYICWEALRNLKILDKLSHTIAGLRFLPRQDQLLKPLFWHSNEGRKQLNFVLVSCVCDGCFVKYRLNRQFIKGPLSASAIFDVIKIKGIARWSEILLLYCKLCSWKYVKLSFIVLQRFPSFRHVPNKM